ncbi:hypothetical protein BJ165DRAFT_971415 [Panaeolus papilionaceus]|nr:hypothetical protein BJ165DRAFT_971415 [Panaeolus papilionaceus]
MPATNPSTQDHNNDCFFSLGNRPNLSTCSPSNQDKVPVIGEANLDPVSRAPMRFNRHRLFDRLNGTITTGYVFLTVSRPFKETT